MDIQSAKKIIYPAVLNAILALEEENIEVKITMLRDIFNEAINGALNISHNHNSEIKATFSGRGRAWAKTDVDANNPVWLKIKEILGCEINTSHVNSKVFNSCTNMLDLFEISKIAWMRFYSAKNNIITFHVHVGGSQTQDFIKVRINKDELRFISNLEGVPHKLNLESGNFLNESYVKKEIINIPISNEDLKKSGIQTLESLLGEDQYE